MNLPSQVEEPVPIGVAVRRAGIDHQRTNPAWVVEGCGNADGRACRMAENASAIQTRRVHDRNQIGCHLFDRLHGDSRRPSGATLIDHVKRESSAQGGEIRLPIAPDATESGRKDQGWAVAVLFPEQIGSITAGDGHLRGPGGRWRKSRPGTPGVPDRPVCNTAPVGRSGRTRDRSRSSRCSHRGP